MSNAISKTCPQPMIQLLDESALEAVTGGLRLSDQEPSVNVVDCRSGMCWNELTGWMDPPGTGGGSCYG